MYSCHLFYFGQKHNPQLVNISICMPYYVQYVIYSWSRIFAGSDVLLPVHSPFDMKSWIQSLNNVHRKSKYVGET